MEKVKSTFIISLDVELAWGEFDLGLVEKHKKYYDVTRECLKSLLCILEKYNIKATFAFVGHLMLDECTMVNGVKHPDIIRPNFKWFTKDWFFYDPCSNGKTNPIWYGIDILNLIKEASPVHEIASHSFSHIILGDAGCGYDCARSDISKCVEIAIARNIKLQSFVFPRNCEGYKNILKDYGFQVYRGSGDEWYKKIKVKKLRKIGHFIDEFFAIAPNTSMPTKDDFGLYNTKGNMLYLSRNGLRKFIPISSRVKKAQKGIDKAIKNGEVFHLWFHPFNLATDRLGLLNGLEEILRYARVKIDMGLISNITMGDIPKVFEN